MLPRLLLAVAVVLKKPGSMLLMMVAKVMIQRMLFSLFLYMYGLPALMQMNQRATIAIKSKVDIDGISAPSFTIAARDRTTGLSWKMEKVGISSLPTHDTTRRLPDSGGGEGRRRRG